MKYLKDIIRSIIIYIIVLFIVSVGVYLYRSLIQNDSTVSTKVEFESPNIPEITEIIPTSYQIANVPYTVQAPLANWNIHEESCEEAALLMINYFMKKQVFEADKIPANKANQEIIDLVTWQKTNYGSEADLTLSALGKLAKDYYGYNFEVKNNITEYEIKKAISQNMPVVVPVMTHSLGNPNYGQRNSYHVLLITGYDQNGVISNDAGVKEGQNYRYPWSTIWTAIDAQTAKMNQGRDMLVLKF